MHFCVTDSDSSEPNGCFYFYFPFMSAKAETEKVRHAGKNSFPVHSSAGPVQCVNGAVRVAAGEFGLDDITQP